MPALRWSIDFVWVYGMKTLWVVGGGIEAVPGIQRAKSMGLTVIVSDGNPQAPGFAYADSGLIIDTYDAKATALMAQAVNEKTHIDGVIVLAADVPVTVAMAAQAIGTPGLPLPVAKLGADKLAMKQRLHNVGIRTAKGVQVKSSGELKRLWDQFGRDVVVKPFDSRGARGVSRVLFMDRCKEAFDRAVMQSPTRRVLVEEWLSGPQISTETVILNSNIGLLGGRRAATPGFLDRNYGRLNEFEPYVIEDGADAPTRLSPADKAAVIALAEKAALAVTAGVPCTVKGDLVLTPEGPAVIELALRLSGGYMSSRLIPLNTGVDLVAAAINIAMGENVMMDDVRPRHDVPVAIRYHIPKGATCHPDRKGHGIAIGDTRDDAIANAMKAIEYEEIHT